MIVGDVATTAFAARGSDPAADAVHLNSMIPCKRNPYQTDQSVLISLA
jgi:hypothetical protein